MHQRIQRPPVPGAKSSSSTPLASKAAPRASVAQSDPAALPGDERSGSVQLAAPHRATDLLHAKASPAEHASRGQELIARELATRVRPHEPPPNNTGLPDNLKAGVEGLSGISLDGVKVHFNSTRPAQLDAFAYAKSREIFVAPGQERHLPHEAWHLIQQAQGRVLPTRRMDDGTLVSDDEELERDAEVMGRRAAAGAVPAGRPPKLPGLRPIGLHFDPGVAQLVNINQAGLKGPDQEVAQSLQFALFLKNEKRVFATEAAFKIYRKSGDLPGKSADELFAYIAEYRGGQAAQAAPLQAHEYGRARTLFGIARDQLGTPLNFPSWTKNDTSEEVTSDIRAQDPAGKLYEMLKLKMGISPNDEERNSRKQDGNPDTAKRIDWMIRSAALAVAVGGGVCNSFGSLTAIMLRLEGVSGVKLMGTDLHNWAAYGPAETRVGLDPWNNKNYKLESSSASGATGVAIVHLDQIPDSALDALYDNFKAYEAEARQHKVEILASNEPEVQAAVAGYEDTPHAKRAAWTIVWEEVQEAT